MPIYEYQCEDCGHVVEAFQKMSDEPLTVCEKCGGPLRKVLQPVAIHFKGSGWAKKDRSATAVPGKASAAKPADEKTEATAAPAKTDTSASGPTED